MFTLSKREWRVLRALTEMAAKDAEKGDFDRGLVESGLIASQPSASELRVIADVVFLEASQQED